MKHLAFISLGSNYGDRMYYLAKAAEYLNCHMQVSIDAVSDIYQTPPAKTFGNSFYNQCISLYTSLCVFELFELVQQAEISLNRTRNYPKSIRTIDIDIITYDDARINSNNLQIPHPRALTRSFVIIPMEEIIKYRPYDLLADFIKKKHYDCSNSWIIKLGLKGGGHG